MPNEWNDYQVKAINHDYGPAAVIGNAGSGKTAVITERIRRLIKLGVSPKRILAMTFTRTAAAELETRLRDVSGAIGTIHSFAYQIARKHLSGVPSDGKEAILLKKLVNKWKQDRKLRGKASLAGITAFIEAVKICGPSPIGGHLWPRLYTEGTERCLQMATAKSGRTGICATTMLELLLAYEAELRTAGFITFDDMLAWAWMTLASSEEERWNWSRRWDYVICDECQDSCPIQWDIARFAAGLNSCINKKLGLQSAAGLGYNLMAGGDPSQCHPWWQEIEINLGHMTKRVQDLCGGRDKVVGFDKELCPAVQDFRIASRFYEGPILLIRNSVRDYLPLAVTPNHRMIICVPSGAGYEEMPAKNLRVGMRVPLSIGCAVRIVNIKEIAYMGSVYSLDVPGRERYAASGIIVHNSIYGFRHAKPNTFVDFTRGADVALYRLPINYRSRASICKSAWQLVREKPWHLGGQLESARGVAEGKEITLREYEHILQEADDVVKTAWELTIDGARVAVLGRLRASLDIVEIQCLLKKLPYVKLNAGSFLDSAEATDAVGYLRVAGLLDPGNEELKRIVNRPFRYIGKRFIEDCSSEGIKGGVAMLDVLRRRRWELKGSSCSELEAFYNTIRQMNELLIDGQVARAIQAFVVGTDYLEARKREDGADAVDATRKANLDALGRMASFFKDVRCFLQYLESIRSLRRNHNNAAISAAKNLGGSGSGSLTLGTIHSAKGLEWDAVFLIDVVEKRFPCEPAMGEVDLDEELRLLYVALTRARDKFQASWSGIRSDFIGRLERCIAANSSAAGT